MTCYVSINIAAPCRVCGRALPELPETATHSVGEAFYCTAHCPVCGPALPDWTEPAKTIAGEQEEIPW